MSYQATEGLSLPASNYLWCSKCKRHVFAEDSKGRLRGSCPICKTQLTYKSDRERIEK